MAEKFGGLVLVSEHRYYADSKPFGKNSWDKGNVNFLGLENPMMDYVNLIQHVKDQYNAHDSPVVTFGSSYSGMIAVWMRMKYPSLV